MRERLFEIIRKEFRQAFREPRMRFMLFLPPLIQLLIFGFAVNLDVDHGQIAWQDGDHTYESRELLSAFQASGRFEVVAAPASDREVPGTARFEQSGPGGARAAGLRARHPPRANRIGSGAGQRHEFEHRQHRRQLREFDRRTFRLRCERSNRSGSAWLIAWRHRPCISLPRK